MHRLLPFLVAAALTLVTPPAAPKPARPPSHPTDAAAMKALASGAAKVEACRTRTLLYYECDDGRPPKGVRFTASTASTYTLAARSRTGRRFTLRRGHGGKLVATCSPRGRGGCGRRGTWKPRPAPVMSPHLGAEWLEQERELVKRMLGLAELIDRCHASTGDFTRCRTAEVEAARRWDGAYTPQEFGFGIELETSSYALAATSRASTSFRYDRRADGTVWRSCTKLPPTVSPCVDGSW